MRLAWRMCSCTDLHVLLERACDGPLQQATTRMYAIFDQSLCAFTFAQALHKSRAEVVPGI